MKATERIVALQLEMLAELQLGPFTDRAAYYEIALVRSIGKYLDEEQDRRDKWESSVEERLRALEGKP